MYQQLSPKGWQEDSQGQRPWLVRVLHGVLKGRDGVPGITYNSRMDSRFAPVDDVAIECEVRLWQGESIHVFVHPREWAKISLYGGVPLSVTCHGVDFHCFVMSCGEFYRSGTPSDVVPSDFDLPGHGDYPATARIDWEKAIPAMVVSGFEKDQALVKGWKSLPLSEMRTRLSRVLRAQKSSTHIERSLELLRDL